MRKMLAVVCMLVLAAGCASMKEMRPKAEPLEKNEDTLRLININTPDELLGPTVMVNIGRDGKEREFDSRKYDLIVVKEKPDRREVCFFPLDRNQPFKEESWWLTNALYEELQPYFRCYLLCLVEDSLYQKLSE